MAARAVLLSDVQSVLSLARRRHGFLLGGATAQKPKQDNPLAVFQSFALLRGRLLRCENMAELSPVNVVKPFLDVIRHQNASSTVTGAALQAVINFLHSWPWADVKDQNAAADAVSDIVDAVSHCRFQETGVESDQNVLVLVVHVLHAAVRSPCGTRLSDHSMWQLVESLYALSRGNRHDPHITLSLRSTATSFLHDTVAFIFSNPAIYADATGGSGPATMDKIRPGFGLPCAVKIVGFLCQKLHQRNFSPPPAPGAPSSSPGAVTSRREVLLSFGLLQRALIACDADLITGVPSLMLFIKDDLCSAILRYCRLGACSELKIPVVCLEIIRLLWSKLRSELKMQVEAIFNGVFYHAMHWTIANLDVNNPDFPRGDDVSLSGPGATEDTEKAVAMVDAATDEFSGEMLSKSRLFSISFEILDCLVDLLAEATLLPDLYVNYDCDGNRCDLTQNLFELLSQVAQQSHVACSESHEETHFLWAQGVGEIALRGMFNALYVVHLRTHPQLSSPGTGDTSNSDVPSDEEAHEDTLLVDQEDQPAPANAAEFASAEVLFKKRQRKKFFQHGIQEFNRKPLAGIKYLQQNTFLPTPLDSVSLATFLRSLPQGLNKNAVGVYLGAMGKEVKGFEKTEIHEADTMDFHRDVLTNFVRSFNFEGESIVAALRMFLASFRLPGEAQQIDRILNTFSLQVYEQCRERFLMASVDVAYLLSFSLIMLNTDLHNPNIRSDKKMKLEDFIKNNKNYGQEVSKGLDLPEDFLTELYNTIAKDEIKTFEDGGKHGEVTSDRWKDLLNQAESDPRNSRLIVHHPSLRSASTPRGIGIAQGTSAPLAPDVMRTMKQARLTKSASSPSATNGLGQTPPKSGRSTQNEESDGLVPSDNASGNQYDRHIFELIQQSLVRAFGSVFLQFVADSNAKDAARGEDLSVGSDYEMHYVPQKSALQLACNGFVLCAAVASHLSLLEHCNSIFIRLCKYTALFSSDIYPVGYNGRENGVWVYCDNQSAPVATAAVLKLVSTCSLSLQSRSWKYFFHVVSGLREFHALPSRILYPRDETHLELMDADERLEFIDLVYQNKEELERKIALSAQDQDGGNDGSGGFFSGVAWLLSALDSNLGGSVPGGSSPAKSHLSPGFEQYQLNPAELASHTEDLLIEGKPPKKQEADSGQDTKSDFGTDQWIRQTLQPYRLEFLIEDIASLPSRALAEVIEALHDEILLVLRGSDDKGPQKDRRKSVRPALSQGGCVLYEHLLSQLIALSGSLFDGGADDEDGISAVLEAHYTQMLEFLRPVLLTNHSPSGLTYENACFLLHKSINGLFAWVTRTRNDTTGLLLVHFLGNLMEMSGDDELIRPFLTPIMCGLDRYVALVHPNNLRYTRMDWLTICNLISWSVSMPHAASHAFGLLEHLVMEKIWNVDGNEILISDCYTKMVMFAMKSRDPHDSWAPSRPIDLLLFMFDTLRPDAPNYVEERLRFSGGMAVVSRHLLLNQIKEELSNELVVAAIEALKHMLREHTSTDQSFKPTAWLDVLRYGLIPIGFDLLNGNGPKSSGAMQFGDDEEETNASFLYYRRQLPSLDDANALQHPKETQTPKAPVTRRRRPSTMKDPLALRPHVVVVQLLSLVVCEELAKLVTCKKFPRVWEDVSELLVGLLEHTGMEKPSSATEGAASGEVLIAALERRSVLSAHEEILEHSKGVIRRLAVLQDEDRTEEGAQQPQTLMNVLSDKCRAHPELFEQLFPSKDDNASTGGLTPPLEEEDSNPEENDSEAS